MSDRLPSIMLSHDFYNKGRNRLWIAEQGAEAVLVLQALWLASSQERDCRIKKEEAYVLPYPLPLPVERIKSILESAVSVGLLEEEDGYYFNSQIVEDHKSFQVKRENYRKGRKKREEIAPESSENPPRIQEQKCQNHIEYEYEPEYELKSKKSVPTKLRGKPPPEAEPPSDLTASELELWTIAGTAFSKIVGDEPWINTSAFINTGRRPLKDYPSIWISHRELFQTLTLYEAKGLDPDEWRECFIACETRAKSSVVDGKQPHRLPTPSWLQSFILNDALEKRVKKLRVQEVEARR